MNGFRKNNKGVALILVIGCVALLSVVGSMLLLVTANNREMKELEEQIQNTFYQAESGADGLLAALEAKAEGALEAAFSDMLIHYSAIPEAERETRIAKYFEEALESSLKQTDAGTILMTTALGSAASDVEVSIPDTGVTVEPSTETGKTGKIKMEGVTIRYRDGDGNAATITTDITIQSGIPDLSAGLAGSGVAADYTDFALITNGDVILGSGMAPLSSAKIAGNLYTAGNINISNTASLTLSAAEKILIKQDINVTNGTLTIDNTGVMDSGQGVWANGLNVFENGTVNGNANFYIADDLTVEGNNVSVVLSGTEYVGFSGNNYTEVEKKSENKSAIVINDASNVNIDLSGVTNVVLNGTSYIHEEEWSGSSIMQGESLAYKDMQIMYLAPAEIIGQSNPVLTSQYSDPSISSAADLIYYPEGTTETLNLANYVEVSNPFVRKDIMLDGGATIYTYLYLNFKNEAAARQYVADYLAIDALRTSLESRIDSLGTSSVISLGVNNYTAGTLMEYVGGTLTYRNLTDSGSTYRTQTAFTAGTRRKALLTSFRMGGTTPANWDTIDVLASAVLTDNAMAEIAAATSTPGTTTYHPYDGDTTITDSLKGLVVVNGKLTIENQIEGIVIVNGDVELSSTSGKVDGLLIATGNVNFVNQFALSANPSRVESLLEDETVAKFLRSSSATSGEDGFLSSEAVKVSFENWQRN